MDIIISNNSSNRKKNKVKKGSIVFRLYKTINQYFPDLYDRIKKQ